MKKSIKAAIQNDNKITKKQLSQMLGTSVRTIERRMAEMPEIKYVGSGNHGHWEIEDK